MYEIRFAEGVKQDMRKVRIYERRQILNELQKQLRFEPMKQARHRKLLAGLIPPWDSIEPVWELRIGEFRVFYDVDVAQKQVLVRAIRRKPHGKTTKEIL